MTDVVVIAQRAIVLPDSDLRSEKYPAFRSVRDLVAAIRDVRQRGIVDMNNIYVAQSILDNRNGKYKLVGREVVLQGRCKAANRTVSLGNFGRHPAWAIETTSFRYNEDRQEPYNSAKIMMLCWKTVYIFSLLDFNDITLNERQVAKGVEIDRFAVEK